MTTFVGTGVQVFRAMVIKHGLAMYRDHHIQVNSAYTPSAMLRVAGEITGKVFKRSQFTAAIEALDAWIAAADKSGITPMIIHFTTDTASRVARIVRSTAGAAGGDIAEHLHKLANALDFEVNTAERTQGQQGRVTVNIKD